MSELQERLEHLVNYSSQLIFVSGDSIAQQQRTLENFLAVQKENTEISYFTSEITMESPDFRRIICRQLLGQKVGSFVRPLKELLKDLHEQPGPFLLCIKQAQTLPNAFLQELWDWVTESKTQSPNHHVNVILFGETAWAEKAKKWLPKRNSNRPVLLSTQSVDSTKFDVNALETLMAEERPTFSLDLFRRNEFSPPVVTQKWFIVGVLILLFSVFVGLMTWQYPEHVKSLLQTGKLPSDATINSDQLALLNEQLDRQLEKKEDTSDIAQSTAEVEPLSTANKIQPSSASDSNEDSADLVTSWDAAKQTSSDKMNSLKENINDQRTAKEQEAASLTNLEQSALTQEGLNIDVTEDYLADTAGDFAVPDIISVEQLDATLGKELLAPSQEEQVAMEALAFANKVDEESLLNTPEKVATSVTKEPTTERFFEFAEEALLAYPEPAILLQLSGIQNRNVLDEFIADNQLQDLVWIYQTTRYGGAWYVVLFNQRFDSVNEAREAVELLPSSVRSTEPFAKDLRQIKLEIRNR
ncbi:MAG: DamX protein [Glaciecola sp.]